MPFRLARSDDDIEALALPWETPLAEWPGHLTVEAPSGLYRNVVRFVEHGEAVIAVKELLEPVAVREFELLVELGRRGLPVVRALGLVTREGGQAPTRRRALLLTRYLRHAMPFRLVMAGGSSLGHAQQLLDALADLLVQLHLAGFFWGDCSLSNVLFRRDAGRYSAYLVDAETGEMHQRLFDGARRHDLDITFENVAGEFMDLEAGRKLAPGLEPVRLAEHLVQRYGELWAELTRVEVFSPEETYRIDLRVRRLNDIGFDVRALELRPDATGHRIVLRPQVVEPGHHRGRLRLLTGLDAEENQARRLLNDLDRFRAWRGQELGREMGEEEAATEWLEGVYHGTLDAIPPGQRAKLDDAEIFHQLLEHRWYRSERAGRDLPMSDVVASYTREILGVL
jgi:hypothetical protein